MISQIVGRVFYELNACVMLDSIRSNHTTRICWRFAVDLLADRLYSKSTAFCHQRICPQHLDVSTCCRQICCVATRQQIRSIWFRTDKSTASLQHAGDLLQTCCRQIRCVASKSTANLQQIRVVWFDLKAAMIRA